MSGSDSDTFDSFDLSQSLVATRARRANAGNRLRVLLNAEEPLEEDEIFLEVENDQDFDFEKEERKKKKRKLMKIKRQQLKSSATTTDNEKDGDFIKKLKTQNKIIAVKETSDSSAIDVDQRSDNEAKDDNDLSEDDDDFDQDSDVFSDSGSSSGEDKEEDDIGEKELQKMEKERKRQQTKRDKSKYENPIIAKVKKQEREKQRRLEKEQQLKDSAAQETEDLNFKNKKPRLLASDLMRQERRQSTRTASKRNRNEVIQRLEESEARRAKYVAPIRKVIHRITQAERLEEAKITEQRNLDSLKQFFQQEEDRKQRQRAAMLAKRVPMTSFVRYMSTTKFIPPRLLNARPLIEEIPEKGSSLINKQKEIVLTKVSNNITNEETISVPLEAIIEDGVVSKSVVMDKQSIGGSKVEDSKAGENIEVLKLEEGGGDISLGNLKSSDISSNTTSNDLAKVNDLEAASLNFSNVDSKKSMPETVAVKRSLKEITNTENSGDNMVIKIGQASGVADPSIKEMDVFIDNRDPHQAQDTPQIKSRLADPSTNRPLNSVVSGDDTSNINAIDVNDTGIYDVGQIHLGDTRYHRVDADTIGGEDGRLTVAPNKKDTNVDEIHAVMEKKNENNPLEETLGYDKSYPVAEIAETLEETKAEVEVENATQILNSNEKISNTIEKLDEKAQPDSIGEENIEGSNENADLSKKPAIASLVKSVKIITPEEEHEVKSNSLVLQELMDNKPNAQNIDKERITQKSEPESPPSDTLTSATTNEISPSLESCVEGPVECIAYTTISLLQFPKESDCNISNVRHLLFGSQGVSTSPIINRQSNEIRFGSSGEPGTNDLLLGKSKGKSLSKQSQSYPQLLRQGHQQQQQQQGQIGQGRGQQAQMSPLSQPAQHASSMQLVSSPGSNLCIITGQKSKFRDPKLGNLPYSSLKAYKIIEKVQNGQYNWNIDFGGVYDGLRQGQVHAKGVPPGFDE